MLGWLPTCLLQCGGGAMFVCFCTVAALPVTHESLAALTSWNNFAHELHQIWLRSIMATCRLSTHKTFCGLDVNSFQSVHHVFCSSSTRTWYVIIKINFSTAILSFVLAHYSNISRPAAAAMIWQLDCVDLDVYSSSWFRQGGLRVYVRVFFGNASWRCAVKKLPIRGCLGPLFMFSVFRGVLGKRFREVDLFSDFSTGVW
jgi:hypothetical protein